MMFTGHYNGEDVLTSVRNNVGDLMIQLRHMQQPGLDHLGLHIDYALYAVRNISSVSNQYGISRRLSEAYGISGQNMNFEDRAWIASWHTLNGINHICPHRPQDNILKGVIIHPSIWEDNPIFTVCQEWRYF